MLHAQSGEAGVLAVRRRIGRSVLPSPHPGHAAHGRQRHAHVGPDARVERGGAVHPADGEVHRHAARVGQDGHRVPPILQRPQIHRLQIDLDAAVVLGDVVGRGDGPAVHLHALKAAERRRAAEIPGVDAPP